MIVGWVANATMGQVARPGVEGAAFGMGDPVTPAVDAALDGVAAEVLATLNEEG